MRVCIRGQLLFTGTWKTIMEKYLWSTSVAHQQMIIKPGAPPFPAAVRSRRPFLARRSSLRYYNIIVRTSARAPVCVCLHRRPAGRSLGTRNNTASWDRPVVPPFVFFPSKPANRFPYVPDRVR